MNNIFSPLLRQRNLQTAVVALLLVGMSATAANAQEKAPAKELSDKVSEALGGPIKNAKDASQKDPTQHAEVLRLLDPLIANSAPNSYDREVLTVEKAQELMAMNKNSEAIPSLEEGLRITDQFHYFDENTTLEMVLTLAQIYGQEGQNSKSADQQRQYYAKAYNYVRRYLDQSKAPSADMEQFAASILLQQATVNPSKVDIGLVKQAEVEIQKGMRLAVTPKVQFYELLLSAIQQEGDFKRSADVLERLVQLSPNAKTYWQPLASTYIQLASDGENEDYYIRAILTIERAQQYGFLNTPKDNYTLVGIYLNIHQYDKAVELLDAGLRNGAIESTEENWKLLGQTYQQLHKEQKAIDALKDASKRFPKSGEIELQIGQLYYTLDKIPEAYNYIKLALTKGKVSKPAQTYFLLAYLAFESKKLDEALEYVQKSLKLDAHSKDAVQFEENVKAAIKDRDAAKADANKTT